MVKNTEYYDLLNILPTATQSDIRKSYHKLALKHHPDKGGDAETFKKISLAYSILSNPQTRSEYDKRGVYDNCSDYDPFAEFKSFFKQYDPFFVSKQPIQEKFDIKVTLIDLFNGKWVNMNIKTCICCPCCESVSCKYCNGQGCTECNMSGNLFSECEICDNTNVVNREKNIKIYIEPGTQDRTQYFYKGEGNYSPNSGQGDLVFIIKLIPHPRLKRQQNHLLLSHNISLYEALTGVTIKYVHLDNITYILKSEDDYVVSPDTTLQVNNFGMPELSTRYFGNLYVKFNIVFPRHLHMNESQTTSLFNILTNENLLVQQKKHSVDDEFIVKMRQMDDTPEDDLKHSCKQQ